MIGSTRQVRVFAYGEPCDMRKQYDSLAVLVTGAMGHLILSGDLFVFVGKNRRRAKVLYFDGTGLCLFAKRLERGRFAALWEKRAAGQKPFAMTQSELALFLEGSDAVGRIALSPPEVTYADRRVVFA